MRKIFVFGIGVYLGHKITDKLWQTFLLLNL